MFTDPVVVDGITASDTLAQRRLTSMRAPTAL